MFWGDFLEKLKQFSWRGSKMDCLYKKKRCTSSAGGDMYFVCHVSHHPEKFGDHKHSDS